MRAFIFDKFHTWYDWRLTLTGKSHPDPEPNFNYIKLDGANGTIDATEALTGEVTFADRTVVADFVTSEGTRQERDAVLREISARLHGRKVKIVEPDDPDHYFLGRCKVKPGEKSAVQMAFSIEATCDPWRYAVDAIERTVDVDGTVDVVLRNNDRKTVVPTLTVNGSVTIEYKGATTTLGAGVYKIPDLKLWQGVNVVRLTGTGSVTFIYREAGL